VEASAAIKSILFIISSLIVVVISHPMSDWLSHQWLFRGPVTSLRLFDVLVLDDFDQQK
jgi:hypothetical protein